MCHFLQSPIDIALIAALKGGIRQEIPISEHFIRLTAGDWEELYRSSVEQGVQALVYDGIIRLSPDEQPPRELKLRWALNTEAVEKRWKRYSHTAASLFLRLRKKKIDMMQLKGLGVADFYPQPSHREGGDIDAYFFGEYDRVNKLIAAHDIPVDVTTSPKHSSFYYEGIPVENHRHFLNVHTFAVDRLLEKHLNAYLQSETPEYFMAVCARIRRPGPNFNALFLARHAATHYASGGIVLRHLCDWACFLTACHDRIDFAAIQALLQETRLLPIVNAFTGCAIEALGMPAEYFPPYASNPSIEQKVLNEILHPEYGVEPQGQKAPTILRFKWQRLMASRRRYEMVYGKTFYRRILTSIWAHLLCPATILKLK